MTRIGVGTLLWEPSKKQKKASNLYAYMNWLKQQKGLGFEDYHSLWKWSVNVMESCFASMSDYVVIRAEQPYEMILTIYSMPGAKCFPEATNNFPEHIFRNRDEVQTVIIHASEK